MLPHEFDHPRHHLFDRSRLDTGTGEVFVRHTRRVEGRVYEIAHELTRHVEEIADGTDVVQRPAREIGRQSNIDQTPSQIADELKVSLRAVR